MGRLSQGNVFQKKLGISKKHLLDNVGRESTPRPIVAQALVGEQRIVPTEKHAVLQPAGDFVLEVRREILRRPAVHFVPDIGLVKKYGDGLCLPGPAGARRNDQQLRIPSSNRIKMPRMAMVEDDPTPAGFSHAFASRAHRYQYRHEHSR